MVRIVNGVFFEDGKPGRTVINTNGGNYVESIKGGFVQGSVVGGQSARQQRRDLSKDGDAVDVKATEV